MKFNFKIQQYQTEAVDAVIKVFNGQGYHEKTSYIRDLGTLQMPQNIQTTMSDDEKDDIYDETGFKNEMLLLNNEQLLNNIRSIQSQNNIKLSTELVKGIGQCSLDIEMETCTGKNYVYIKTMF